jgi:hypothetical protein
MLGLHRPVPQKDSPSNRSFHAPRVTPIPNADLLARFNAEAAQERLYSKGPLLVK